MSLDPLPPSAWTRRTADHLLSRTSFGGTPAQREALFQLGKTQVIAAAVSSIIDQAVDWSAFPLPTLPPPSDLLESNDRLEAAYDLTEWFLLQMKDGPALAAKMLKFWLDHFPVDLDVIEAQAGFIYFYKHLDVLRTLALGNFGLLLREVSWSEGMIRMLDLDRSRRGQINENFGRELLELFTLGVDGGYTEQDVTHCAEAFTGRSLSETEPFSAYLDELVRGDGEYRRIDPTEKTFLTTEDPANPGIPVPGTLAAIKDPADQLPGDPKDQGDMAIALILEQVQCAEHLGKKIWRYFVGVDPEASLMAELGRQLRDHDYEIAPLLRTIFQSEEFYDEAAIGNQIKDPVDIVISIVKVLEMPLLPRATTYWAMDEMGQNLLHPPTIQGWPEPVAEGNRWMTVEGLLSRINLASLWVHGDHQALRNHLKIPTTGGDAETPYVLPDYETLLPAAIRGADSLNLLIDHLADRVLYLSPIHPRQRQSLIRHMRRKLKGLDRDKVYRRVLQQLLALPQFQMQ
ncbi:MAG: DUF1800 family protein [Verrucomicrobiaceae bacterium]|nr:DUF1800 family protein [Verrucomicrobiaceae bacterium]